MSIAAPCARRELFAHATRGPSAAMTTLLYGAVLGLSIDFLSVAFSSGPRHAAIASANEGETANVAIVPLQIAVTLDEEAWIEYGHSRLVRFAPSDAPDAVLVRNLGCKSPRFVALAQNPLANFHGPSDQAMLSFELTGIECKTDRSTYSAQGSITGDALRGEHFREQMTGAGSYDLFGLVVSKGTRGVATVLSIQAANVSTPPTPGEVPIPPAR